MEIEKLLIEAVNSTKDDFLKIVSEVLPILKQEKKIIYLPKKGKMLVCGDLHGDFESLSTILKKIWKSDYYLLFLGDYGDRGEKPAEVYFSILKLKTVFPSKIFLLRGNHEGPARIKPFPHNLPYQFYQRYKSAEPYQQVKKIWKCLPLVAISEGKYLFLHGGLPASIKTIEDFKKEENLEEILWSDPAERAKGAVPSPRGSGKLFGEDITEKVLKKLNVRVLIRSHYPAKEGFQINHRGKVLTIFSTKMPLPYQNQKRAVLEIDLEEEVEDAYSLEKKIIFF